MITVGVREVKEQASELLRRVREEGGTVEITCHGQLSARLVPVTPPPPDEAKGQALLVSLDQLAAEIGQQWQGENATSPVREVRREL